MIKSGSSIETTDKEIWNKEPYKQERNQAREMKCSSLGGPYQRSAEAPPKQRAGARVLGGFEN